MYWNKDEEVDQQIHKNAEHGYGIPTPEKEDPEVLHTQI